jgi:hypothetical protein
LFPLNQLASTEYFTKMTAFYTLGGSFPWLQFLLLIPSGGRNAASDTSQRGTEGD